MSSLPRIDTYPSIISCVQIPSLPSSPSEFAPFKIFSGPFINRLYSNSLRGKWTFLQGCSEWSYLVRPNSKIKSDFPFVIKSIRVFDHRIPARFWFGFSWFRSHYLSRRCSSRIGGDGTLRFRSGARAGPSLSRFIGDGARVAATDPDAAA